MDRSETLQKLQKMFEEQLRRPLTGEEIRLLSLTVIFDNVTESIVTEAG